MTAAESLLELRKNNNLSQEEFAEKLMITRQAVSRWETGETVPNTDTLKIISETFGISVNSLLGSAQNTKPDSKSRYGLSNEILLKFRDLIVNDNGFNMDKVQGCYYDEDTADGVFIRNHYKQILQAVARWHGAFWENNAVFAQIGLDWRYESKENLLVHISAMEKDFKKYRKNEESGKIPAVWEFEERRFENHITPDQLDCFANAIDRLKSQYVELTETRFQPGHNITIIHGDMHPGTVWVSKTGKNDVRFDGLQAVRIGLPTEDLAMLIALHIEPDRQKALPLLDFYYRLISENAEDYSYETFMSDYKIAIMENMFFTVRLINRGIFDFKMRDKAIRAFESFVLNKLEN
ncbi:MAG: helix-turn-helix domain-containing protein [Oscillospiraceae bacterium]|nr:helix-turn-helix domain-containing protein [Oscillospiraceae bacterium]